MTSALEFTYLYDGFSLKISESTMNRAVRVKTAVKDKIKRVFKSKEVTVSNDNVTPVEPVQTVEKESLIDLSQEKLLDLNNILNGLQEQKSVSYTVNRAVLFTQPLVAKINRVSAKWFNGMPRVEKKEETPSAGTPSVDMINHLGGEVVPGNWNSAVNEMENNQLSLEPTLEPVPSIEPVLTQMPEVNLDTQENTAVTDALTLNSVLPTLENSVSTSESVDEVESNSVPQVDVPKVNIEIPTISENTDIYRFPSFDFNMESVAPTVTNEVVNESPVSNTTFDFVPEPRNVEEEEDYITEPTTISSDDTSFAFEMPSFDPVVPTVTVEKEEPVVTANEEVKQTNNSPKEDAIGELINREFTPNPKNDFVPEHIDDRPAEEKIDELLGRDKVIEKPTLESSIEPEVTSVPEQKEEKPVITQGQIIARLRRVNNEMAEKDATIKSLSSKNETLKEEVALNKDKVAEYEVKVTDLSARNTDLTSQNERLSAKLEEVETNSRTTIAKLEAKVEEVTHSRDDEIESLRRQIEEMKTKHASEISSIKNRHSAELKLVTETKDKQIQAIYSTISEALGETPIEDDYTRSMAA